MNQSTRGAGDPIVDPAQATHRPQYHFLPPANWMNDPNGLIQWQGKYHLFYQYNPNGPFHGTIHWGHTVSYDLVHWTDLPIAMAPSPGGPDKDGCFSGCAVNNHGVATFMYTGVHPETQCLATSEDGLITWQKHPGNPVIAAPPPGLDTTGFRDPFVWQDGGIWYAAVGSGIKGVGGTVLLYQSADLVHWDYLNPICTGRLEETGSMWECPNFFPLGDKHVLLISPIPLRKTLFLIGAYDGRLFTPETQGIIDNGGCFYAPQTMLDDTGRRLMWGWLWERSSKAASCAAGWAGIMSLPRLLSILPDGTLGQQPVPELTALRGAHHHYSNLVVAPGAPAILPDPTGVCLEIVANFERGDALAFGIQVCRSPDGEEQTSIYFDGETGDLVVDTSRASTDATVAREVRRTPLPSDQTLKLRIFLDRSALEVFANDRVCLASRIYPTRADSRGLALFARGGAARLSSLDAWEMHSIWPVGERSALSVTQG